MKILGYSFFEKDVAAIPAAPATAPATPEREPSSFMFGGDGPYISTWGVGSTVYNGEKTPGSLGHPYNLIPDYQSLRVRAHSANFTVAVIKIITGKYFKWIVGKGLKFQSEPDVDVLELEGIKEDFVKYQKNTEAYFRRWGKSKTADYSGMKNLHQLAREAFSTKFLSGDALIVLRLDENLNPTVQVIDGGQVRQPLMAPNWVNEAKARGNTIVHGIELDPKGQHVAYYVVTFDINNIAGKVERIEARGSESGCLMAWMIYGSKARVDHHRGVPEISAILELVAKLDRYTEASVATAEERAKIVYTVEHGRDSDGENPLLARARNNMGGTPGTITDPFLLGEAAAKNIAISEERSVYNLPVDSKLVAVSSQSEIQYESFFKAIFVQICASIDIPPEVALQQYNSNYSASRAAINGWGYIVDITRELFCDDFYQPIYNFWLYVHILKNKVSADGYLKAVNEHNSIVVESYSGARFTGAVMPHIDPLKEANALRIMLGDLTTPLMTNDQATEQYGLGEWDEIIRKVTEERKKTPPLLPGQVKANVSSGNSSAKEDKADPKPVKVKET